MNCSELNELADAYNKYGEEYRAMYIEDRRDMIDSVKDALAKKPGKTIQIKGVSVSADDFLGIFMDELEESIRTLEKNDQVFKNMAITTNGCFSLEQKWPILKKFQYINFSLHSLNEAYFSTLIGAGRNASIFLDLITNNIKELRQRMSVRINTVVGADENFQKVEDILDFAAKLNIELKLVPEWSVQILAINNIMNLLSKKGFFLYEKIHLLPGSNIRERYKNAQGQIVEVKKIDFYWPDFLCKNCDKKIICQEGFSFLRIGGNPLYFQPCIFQNKLTPDEFQKNILPELIHIFREAKK